MGLKKLAAKVDDYNQRLESGKASEIKEKHVAKVLAKLRAKEADLAVEIVETEKPDKKARLERKLAIAREQMARAEWLLKELT